MSDTPDLIDLPSWYQRVSPPLEALIEPALVGAPLPVALAAAQMLGEDRRLQGQLASRADLDAAALAALAERWPDSPFAVASAALARGDRRGRPVGTRRWRSQLAGCPRAPLPTLAALARDADPAVLAAVVRNPAAPSALRADALLRLDTIAADHRLGRRRPETARVNLRLIHDGESWSPWPTDAAERLLDADDAERVLVNANDPRTATIAAAGPLTAVGVAAGVERVLAALAARPEWVPGDPAELTVRLAAQPLFGEAHRDRLATAWRAVDEEDYHPGFSDPPAPTLAEVLTALAPTAPDPLPVEAWPWAALIGVSRRSRGSRWEAELHEARAAAGQRLVEVCGTAPDAWQRLRELRPGSRATLGEVLSALHGDSPTR